MAEAAREHFLSRRLGAWGELRDALRDLDALTTFRAAAKPEGETVEVRIGLWRGTTIQRLHAEVLLDDDGADHEPHWRRIATIVARVPLPVVPTIEAEVEAP